MAVDSTHAGPRRGVFQGAEQLGALGDADQVGAVNLITTAKRGQAQTLVRTGRTVSLARDIGPQPAGATWCPIDPLFDGITTRGVFLDVAAARKDGFAKVGEPVTPRELDAAAARAGVRVEPVTSWPSPGT